jgi:ferredoxin
MKVSIDEAECIGCGSCVELCPKIFLMNEDKEKAEVIQTEGGAKECIEEAREACPVSCIHWDEE